MIGIITPNIPTIILGIIGGLMVRFCYDLFCII
ncbi:uncharacterized protein METZ01_LOCUS103307 [marine metagenome]|uniref:Uncharacterized protein n=1 Tax=marine metagenome TaxID=408172 RepID=A0A381WEU8_9ZZZZ